MNVDGGNLDDATYLVFSNIFIYVPVESRVLAKNRLLTINEL
jgi:hypothetical protein